MKTKILVWLCCDPTNFFLTSERRLNSKHSHRVNHTNHSMSAPSLEYVLEHDYVSFLKFSEDQFAGENLRFWADVEDFKSMGLPPSTPRLLSKRFSFASTPSSTPDLSFMRSSNLFTLSEFSLLDEDGVKEDKAKEIVSKYFQDHSPHGVCLPVEVVQTVEKRINNGDIGLDLFDEAQKVIYFDLKLNLYPLYLRQLPPPERKKSFSFLKRRESSSREEEKPSPRVSLIKKLSGSLKI